MEIHEKVRKLIKEIYDICDTDAARMALACTVLSSIIAASDLKEEHIDVLLGKIRDGVKSVRKELNKSGVDIWN